MVPSKRLKLLSVRLRHSLGAQAESQTCPKVLPFSPIQFPLFWPIQSCTQPPRCLSCSRCCLQGTRQARAAPAATERQQDQPIHLLLNAWTAGLAEEGFFRPPEGLEPREEHCLPLGNLATVACDFWWKWPIRINPSHWKRSRGKKKKKQLPFQKR